MKKSCAQTPNQFIFVMGTPREALNSQLGDLKKTNNAGASCGWTAEVLTITDEASRTKFERRVESLWRTSRRHTHRRTRGQKNGQTLPRSVSDPYELWFHGAWSDDQIELITAEVRKTLGESLASTNKGLPQPRKATVSA